MGDEHGPKKPIRSILGPAATELLAKIPSDGITPVPARLDAAILALQERADQAQELAAMVTQEKTDQRLDAIERKLDALIKTAPDKPELARLVTGHDDILRTGAELRAAFETALRDQSRYFVAELRHVHISINIMRDYLYLVISALNDEELVDMINKANAQIDALIQPLKHQTYDPAIERAKLLEDMDRRQQAAIRAQEGGQSHIELDRCLGDEERER